MMSNSPAANPSSAPASGFTPRMQDAQARNKDPYALSSDSESGSSERYDEYGHESYEAVLARREAAVILDNPELLMMHAQARNETIPATRHHFTKQLCGYLDPNELPQDDPQPQPAAPGSHKSKKKRIIHAGPSAESTSTNADTAMADAEGSGSGSGSAAAEAEGEAAAGPSGNGSSGAINIYEDEDEDDDMD